MSSKYTEKYKLCQWTPGDKVLHTDFNEDNRKIEEALNDRNVRILCDSYTGRGTNQISCGYFRVPVMLFITGGGFCLQMLRPSTTAVCWSATGKCGLVDVEWRESGLMWTAPDGDADLVCNRKDVEYFCIALLTPA